MNVIALHLIVLQLLTPLNAELNKLYDNEDIAAEYNSAGTLLRSYIHGQGIDEPIRMTDHSTSASYYYLADGLGSIVEIQDADGNTIETYSYDSFGNPTILDSTGTELTESAISNPYMFTAREWDAETGLYYYRARYYDAGVGRFISEDPIRFWGGVNFYLYVENNPTNYRDPYGLFWGELGKDQGVDYGREKASDLAGSLFAGECAKRYCRNKKVKPINFTSAWADCDAIMDKARNGGVPVPYGDPLVSSDSIIDACANGCIKIVKSDKFKKDCECPE